MKGAGKLTKMGAHRLFGTGGASLVGAAVTFETDERDLSEVVAMNIRMVETGGRAGGYLTVGFDEDDGIEPDDDTRALLFGKGSSGPLRP